MRILVLLLLSAAAVAAPFPPALEDTLVVRSWLLAGPLPVGPREGISGLVDDPDTFRPVPGETLWSALVPGGQMTWREVTADSAGWLETGYPDVPWDTIMDYWGIAGLMNAGYAWAEFELPRACRALALSARCGLNINGRDYQGNPYNDNWAATPVMLDSGTNRILLSASGFADSRFRFLLVPPEAPVRVVGGDITVPDLVVDSAGPVLVGIPLLNTLPRRCDGVRVRVRADSVIADTTVGNLPPLGVLKLALSLNLPARHDTGSVELVVECTFDSITDADTVRLEVREPGDIRRVTFLSSIDNSCQYYGIRYPKDYDPSRRYALLLALHGAGSRPEWLLGAYPPLDWAFVVAPMNRRPFGFDWQDWGRLDAIEVLDRALATLPIDPDRVGVTGHSMGGHGTWHVGLTHADRFAAAASGAGWPSFQLYIPWFLQRSEVFAAPGQVAIRNRALAPDNTPAFLDNARNLPWFIIHGEADDNVPPVHGRGFAAWLAERGYEFRYKELPGKGHWWQTDDGQTPVSDTALLDFLQAHRRDPGPRRVSFRSADLGQSSRAYWVEVERARVVGEFSTVEATAGDSSVTVATTNVDQLRLDLDERLPFAGVVAVELDGQRLPPVRALPANVRYHRRGDRWQPGPARRKGLGKTPAGYGPAKQAMYRPFVLVYGTADPAQSDDLRHEATEEGMRWWLRANGRAEVLPDTAVTDSIAARVNLVLFGGPDANTVTRRLSPRLPVQVRQGEMYLAGRRLGPDLAALFVYPNPEHPERLVLIRMGTDAERTRLAGFWGLVHSGAGIPDFVVFGNSVRKLGWGGVRAAGFFGPDWRFDPASSWVAE